MSMRCWQCWLSVVTTCASSTSAASSTTTTRGAIRRSTALYLPLTHAMCTALLHSRGLVVHSLDNAHAVQLAAQSLAAPTFSARNDETKRKHDHQALIEAKYCLRVAASPGTQKNKKKSCDLDLWPMTLKLNRALKVVKVHVRAISSSWVQRFMSYRANIFLSYLAMVKNPKIRSCHLDLWPMTFKLRGFRKVIKRHVLAKFHQAKCGRS